MTRFIIDTDCAVYAMAGQFAPLADRLEQCAPGEVAISTISVAEIMLGTIQGKLPSIALFDSFVEAIPMLPFDEAAARVYATLPFRLARFDRLIAAHALSLGAAIVTDNEIDFADVPGLAVENWTR